MSAPESNSKGRPSLLTEPTGNAPRDDSRILANLEGRVAPPPQRPKRSRVLPAVVAVLVIALGGWGAWLVKQQRAPEETAKVATVSENVVRKSDAPALAAKASGAATGSATVIAASDGASAAVTAAADASAASASTAATIVADDDAAKDASAAAPVQAASDDASRLSRALSAGTEASGAAPATLATQQHDSAQKSEAVAGSKHGAHDRKLASTSRDRHQTASSERNGKDKAATVAHANTRKSTVRHETAKDDSDADLLAALVARTKPADPKAMNAVAASGPSAAAPAKKVSTSSGTGKQGTLAERINECSQHGFFEEQLCRWRACDGHWGKDPHCPATSAQARQP